MSGNLLFPLSPAYNYTLLLYIHYMHKHEKIGIFTFRCHRAAALSLTFLGTILTNHFLTTVVIDCSQVPAAEIKWKLRQATGVQKISQASHSAIAWLSVCLLISNLPRLFASQINIRAAGSHAKLRIST